MGMGSKSNDDDEDGQMGEDDDDDFPFLVLLNLVGTPNSWKYPFVVDLVYLQNLWGDMDDRK